MSDTAIPPALEQTLQTLIAKISNLETNIAALAKDNFNQMQEIALLGQKLALKSKIEMHKNDVELTLDNDDASEKNFTLFVKSHAHHSSRNAVKTEKKTSKLYLPATSQSNGPPEGNDESDDEFLDFSPRHRNPTTNVLIAKDVIRAIKPINGRDDMGVENFIKSVKKWRKRCSQPELLLDYIIAEKITQQAEKAIRYIQFDDYETLYESLRANLK